MADGWRSRAGVESYWTCSACGWTQRSHPAYGWSKDDERAVEVHLTRLCPLPADASSQAG